MSSREGLVRLQELQVSKNHVANRLKESRGIIKHIKNFKCRVA
nr:MAG TPA: hypothetical protein [Caudoviricetes sp.]